MKTSPLSPQTLRRLHRKLAPILFLPFLLVALTGLIYQVGARSRLLPLPQDLAELVIQLHNGEILGTGQLLYASMLTLGFVGMGISGILILRRIVGRKSLNDRSIHNTLSPFLILPFFATGMTGSLYVLGERFFGFSPDLSEFLLKIHAGEYLGSQGSLIYVLFLGIGLITMVVTGIRMTSLFRPRRAVDSDSNSP